MDNNNINDNRHCSSSAPSSFGRSSVHVFFFLTPAAASATPLAIQANRRPCTCATSAMSCQHKTRLSIVTLTGQVPLLGLRSRSIIIGCVRSLLGLSAKRPPNDQTRSRNPSKDLWLRRSCRSRFDSLSLLSCRNVTSYK